jgi:CheY-like chemotaxis protein
MGLKILICDDDKDILEVCKTILEAKGYKIITRSTCDGIINIIQTECPDIILMDLWLPPLGGETAIREIKAHPLFHSIPLEQIAKSSNAECFLKKPFDIDEFERLIEELTDNVITAQQ